MSWKLGRSKKSSTANLRAEELANGRSTTPTPANPDGRPLPRTGLLSIRVLDGEGIGLPQGMQMPPAVQNALSSQQAKIASSVSAASVQHSRMQRSKGNRLADFYLCLLRCDQT
jgi:serum/glucocorticoid-regulated kinase 2